MALALCLCLFSFAKSLCVYLIMQCHAPTRFSTQRAPHKRPSSLLSRATAAPTPFSPLPLPLPMISPAVKKHTHVNVNANANVNVNFNADANFPSELDPPLLAGRRHTQWYFRLLAVLCALRLDYVHCVSGVESRTASDGPSPPHQCR
jgi:hypothetical protein